MFVFMFFTENVIKRNIYQYIQVQDKTLEMPSILDVLSGIVTTIRRNVLELSGSEKHIFL